MEDKACKTVLNAVNDIKHDFKTTHTCTRCGKSFKHGSSFINHISKNKACNKTQDNLSFFQHNMPFVFSKYGVILAIVDDDIISIAEKRRMISACYKKALKLLLSIRGVERPKSSGITDDLLKKLMRMTLNMKMADYDNEDYQSININDTYDILFPALPVNVIPDEEPVNETDELELE